MTMWSFSRSRVVMRRVALLAGVMAAAAGLAAGCVGGSAPPADNENVQAAAQAVGSCAPAIDPAKSLLVTDPAVLARFPLQSVLNQILASADVAGPGALELYRRLWDTQNTTAGAFFTDAFAIHCDSQLNSLGQPAINGFPVQCPRNEGALGNPANPLTDPFIDGTPAARPNFMKPVAVINRFDLAPSDGSHCGEYRIIYEKKSGEASALNRTTLIFEGVLPNPNPGCGVLACREVADFWANLSSETDSTVLADKIEEFYFQGLPGFAPVVDANHYGMGALGGGYGATSKGQVRTNQFMPGPNNQIWQLREFQLERVCKGGGTKGELDELDVGVEAEEAAAVVEPELGGPVILPVVPACFLRFKPVTVKNNPFGPMFNNASTDARTADFRTDLVNNQLEALSENAVDFIAMNTPDDFNAGQSNSQPSENDYRVQMTGNTALSGAITGKLSLLGRTDLVANNMADRATTQSCGGCHDLSNNDRLGGAVDPRWPTTNGFVHVDEFSQISPALRFVFLPHRKGVLRNFLDTTCGEVCSSCGDVVIKSQAAPGSNGTQVKTIGGSVTH